MENLMENKKITLFLKVTFDWDDYEDVADQLLLEDSGILDSLKNGVNIEIISKNE